MGPRCDVSQLCLGCRTAWPGRLPSRRAGTPTWRSHTSPHPQGRTTCRRGTSRRRGCRSGPCTGVSAFRNGGERLGLPMALLPPSTTYFWPHAWASHLPAEAIGWIPTGVGHEGPAHPAWAQEALAHPLLALPTGRGHGGSVVQQPRSTCIGGFKRAAHTHVPIHHSDHQAHGNL